MLSKLHQPTSPFPGAVVCPPGRTEQTFTVHKNGLMYKFVARDKVVVEDPYIVLIKAEAFAIRHGSPYPGGQPPREVRDFLIKTSVRVG